MQCDLLRYPPVGSGRRCTFKMPPRPRRVQAYSVDADLTNALRLARDDAHQVTGALRMVGLEGAATCDA